jgi:GTP cyclohydrolase II
MGHVERFAGSSLLGEPNFVEVERAIAELRSGRPVAIENRGTSHLTLPVDWLDARQLSAFRRFCAPAQPAFTLTAARARELRIESDSSVTLTLAPHADAALVRSIASDARFPFDGSFVPANAAMQAALRLCKLAHRLPAVLSVEGEASRWDDIQPAPVTVQADAVTGFRDRAVRALKITGEARVPLQNGVSARFIVFRGMIGGESAAIVIGDPDFSKPVQVRLHSACLTGDVFGSRRCDCGDQLELALTQIADTGGGVILYLDQEGRGVGLANKMRAYALQDAGLDTVDANTALGFEDDERDYGVAGRMLQMIGCTKVRLMTNNPAKINGLLDAGIEITGRVPLITPVNGDNRRYLAAKATRAGHSLDHLFEQLAANDCAIVPDKEAAS